MRTRSKAALAGIALVALTGSLMAGDKAEKSRFAVRADLVGGQEVPALSTTGRGQFRAWIDTEANVIHWKLSYDGLEGAVTQAHVHFGQRSVNGGISFFLCSNLANPPAGTQACPTAGPAELEGTITPEAVVGPVPPRRHQVRASNPERSPRSRRPFAMAWPMRTCTRPSGRAAKSAVNCADWYHLKPSVRAPPAMEWGCGPGESGPVLKEVVASSRGLLYRAARLC